MFRSYLPGYIDAYIVIKGTIDLLAAANENHKAEKDVVLRNNSYVAKIFHDIRKFMELLQR